ncbi:MAG: hypothetical protein GEU95_19095 [Rhizobiales bacterium]|nr:hypothetical protein [Hyphomicrobiales bacterium]
MSARLAARVSLRYLTAALVAGLALSLTPTAPAVADGRPVVSQPRVRTYAPRVRPYAPRVRTVVRTRAFVIPQPVYYSCGGCAPAVAVAPRYYAPRYYARYYAAGYGGCAQPVAAPYYWAVRYARYRYADGYY